jgi:chloride channel protein, CIC family
MPTSSIMTEKLARRGLRIHQDYETDVLQQVAVAETMDREAPVWPADMRIKELADRIARRDPEVSRHQGMLIREGKLAGVVSRGDILRALDKDPEEVMTVLEAGIISWSLIRKNCCRRLPQKCWATALAASP